VTEKKISFTILELQVIRAELDDRMGIGTANYPKKEQAALYSAYKKISEALG